MRKPINEVRIKFEQAKNAQNAKGASVDFRCLKKWEQAPARPFDDVEFCERGRSESHFFTLSPSPRTDF